MPKDSPRPGVCFWVDALHIALEAGDLLRPHRAGLARYAECLIAALLGQDESTAIEAWAPLRRSVYWFASRPSARLRFFCKQPPRRRPDIFHATSCVFPDWKSWVEIATVHDLYGIRPEQGLAADELERRSRYIWRADALICISEHTRDHLHSLLDVPREITQVIRPAPHPRFIPATAEAKRWLQRRYGLAEEFLLFLGRDRANKNLDRLVEAHALARLDIPLYFCGEHSRSTRHRLQQSAAAHGCAGPLRWLGRWPEEELPILLSCASALCIPSTFEGFGLPIVEAMACRTAVVTSAGRATEEASGGMAVLVDPESTESIADGLVRALARTQSQLAAARRYAASRTWKDVAGETLRVYRQHAFRH
jgi:glycosyltransferase involved in cell wall biosynthesis